MAWKPKEFVSGISLHAGPEKLAGEVLEVHPGLGWRPQDAGDDRVMD